MPPLPKPPGQRLIKRMSTRTKWLILSPISLIVIGYGLCVFSGAGHAMQTNAPFAQWFWLGTYSLVLINGGLCLLGQAIRYRVMLDTRRIIRQQLRKRDREQRQKRRTPLGRQRRDGV